MPEMQDEAGGEKVKTVLLSLTGATAAFLAGCTSPDPTAAIQDVEKTVAARTGSTLRWSQNDEESKEVREAIDALLQTNLTAEAAIQIALWNNPALRAELEEIGISQAEVAQAGLLRNPQFGASWRFPDRPPSAANMEYSVVGNFLDILMLPVRKKVAAFAVDQAKLRVAHEVLTLAAEVQEAFYTLQAHQQLLRRLKLILEVNEASAEFSKRLHLAGNITDLEYANQQAVYAQSRASVARARTDIRVARQRMNRLLGLWGKTTDWKVDDQLPEVPAQELPLENLEQLAIRQRLDLGASLKRMNLAGAELSLKRKLRFVPAEVSLGVSSERGTDGQWVTGPRLELELPIFDQRHASIARMTAEYRQAQRRVEALAINIRSEVQEARDRLIAQRDLAQYYGQVLLPQRIRIVNETLLQYNAMQIGTPDLLAAKERQLEAERDYVEAWREYWIARGQLKKAVGGRLGMPTSDSTPNHSTDSQKKAASKGHEHNH
jgi:cobalt-zinc-cadmium efflux system outer membrane protein